MSEEYRHTPEMGELSGRGGGYEQCCQDMLSAGVAWLKEHADRNPDFVVMVVKNVYGVAKVAGEAGKALEEVVLEASRDAETGEREATGAMHQAVMSRLAWIHHHGWERYVQELTNDRRAT